MVKLNYFVDYKDEEIYDHPGGICVYDNADKISEYQTNGYDKHSAYNRLRVIKYIYNNLCLGKNVELTLNDLCEINMTLVVEDGAILNADKLKTVRNLYVTDNAKINCPNLNRVINVICVEANERLVKELLPKFPNATWELNEKSCKYLIDNMPKNVNLYLNSNKVSKEEYLHFFAKQRWHNKHYNVAKTIAQHSKDSKKIGCVIVNDVNNILATGYNGFPRGFNDDIPERHKRPAKYNYTIHAEANAIVAAAMNGTSLRDSTLYVTWFPCNNCALLIAQAGIKEIVCTEPDFEHERWGNSFKLSHEILNECGIKLTYIADNE